MAREERRTARAEEKSVRKQLAQGKTYRQIRGKHFIDSMEDAEKERYLEYWSTRDPEAMKEYQEFMANKKKNSGDAAAAANESATDTAKGNAAVAAVALMAAGGTENEAGVADAATVKLSVVDSQEQLSDHEGDVRSDAPGQDKQSKRYTPDQQAVIELAKEAKKRKGISLEEAEILLSFAKEYGIPSHGPESHPSRKQETSKNLHIHVGSVDHITIKDEE